MLPNSEEPRSGLNSTARFCIQVRSRAAEGSGRSSGVGRLINPSLTTQEVLCYTYIVCITCWPFGISQPISQMHYPGGATVCSLHGNGNGVIDYCGWEEDDRQSLEWSEEDEQPVEQQDERWPISSSTVIWARIGQLSMEWDVRACGPRCWRITDSTIFSSAALSYLFLFSPNIPARPHSLMWSVSLALGYQLHGLWMGGNTGLQAMMFSLMYSTA